VLSIRDVVAGYGLGIVLHGVSLEINEGQAVAVVGPNGAGKTTLLNVVAGNLAPTSGKATVLGQQLRRSAVAHARAGVGRTFQQLSLFREFTVRDHVMFGYIAGLTERPRWRALWSGRMALDRLAESDESPLGPKQLMADLGLEAVADQLAAEQSVGMARMVDLARALAAKPKLLLLDEPVSGLSELEAEAVGNLLLRLRAQHGMTMVVIEHNLEFARLVAERMVALDFGEVIAAGASAEVLVSPQVRAAYFGTADPVLDSPNGRDPNPAVPDDGRDVLSRKVG
jgi:branched-chain amino acid transport system ATP-binding protein